MLAMGSRLARLQAQHCQSTETLHTQQSPTQTRFHLRALDSPALSHHESAARRLSQMHMQLMMAVLSSRAESSLLVQKHQLLIQLTQLWADPQHA